MDADALSLENAHLKARLAAVEAALAEVQEANRRLENILRSSQRERFGKSSEKLSPDQFNLPLEDAELAQGVLAAAQEKAEAALQRARGETPRKPARNRGHLPSHLPRVERVIEPASILCPCGCGEMARIGEDTSERLDVIPAQFQVLVTRRPRYACRRCSQAVVQAHAPEHVVPGGLPTERLIAWIMVSKFGDHLPFYRQAGILERQGLHLDRGTLGNWTGRACFHLMPVIDHMRAHLRAADRIFVDETRAPVLDPGRKTTKSGYFWAVVSDDRGHGGVGPPIVLFYYAPGRGREHPLRFLAGYRGRFLQCDAYQSYNALTEVARDSGPWQLVYCWTHVRRRFVKRFEGEGSPIAEEMLRQIALLYQIEKTVRGQAPADRLAVRSAQAAPIIAALKPWLETQLSRIPQKSMLAEDIRYTLGHWPGLIRFLDDGTLELDTNPVENQIRPIALTRKNALFAGNEVGAENWAMLASLVATCKMAGVNPVNYFADTLRAILDGHPRSRIEDLMPWRHMQPSSLTA
ncbi:IS66 family transposase [Paracoccus liaowanqingii]|uniref:IS66 family transposase n=1 Tax=Paracoccus liaowanqingii TaxID=2560053 RepID=A0A4Z1CT53_9RHOB|nr:IS66 family transposase [Paracoccus liaowanqingii]TGN68718.1 IS66 family transposase [Paracoccus liaowanqingii]